MSTPGYFKFFPVISYANTAAVDITRRDVVTKQTKRNRFAFHDYQLRSGHRADYIAQSYYGDPMNVWLVWLSADVIDPYFDWYLTPDQLNEFLNAKYGSVANAMNTIAYWSIDWPDQVDNKVSISDFNAQPDPLKKYYQAVFDRNNQIVSYEIKRQDITMTTNKTVYWNINKPSGNGFIKGEQVVLKSGVNSIGNSVVVFSNNSVLVTQHVFGNTSPTDPTNCTFRGNTSNSTANLVTVDNVLLNMPINELVYWNSVSHYDYEYNLNESRKFISLMDSGYLIEAQAELANTLTANVAAT